MVRRAAEVEARKPFFVAVGHADHAVQGGEIGRAGERRVGGCSESGHLDLRG